MSDIDRRTVAWIRRRLPVGQRREQMPTFGSAAWHALDEQDPMKFAAVVFAAACWWDSKHPARIAQQLADELAVAAQLEQRAFGQVAHDVRRRANSPTWSEIERRCAS